MRLCACAPLQQDCVARSHAQILAAPLLWRVPLFGCSEKVLCVQIHINPEASVRVCTAATEEDCEPGARPSTAWTAGRAPSHSRRNSGAVHGADMWHEFPVRRSCLGE